MSRKTAISLIALAVTFGAGCGSSSSTSKSAAPASSAKAGNGVNPNQPESLPPGDIPDTTAFVPYAVPGAGYTVSVPEGWSRSRSGGAVTFTDKLNTVQITAVPARAPSTPASVRSKVVPALASSIRGFKLQSVGSVTRRSGPAVRTAFLGYSPPNPVTGKFGTLAVERYDFFHGGRDVVVTLSAPNGSDNVDPWRKVTDSLTFTR
ncbi:MAG: lipoprotein [Thermoleophilaceae bacterium]